MSNFNYTEYLKNNVLLKEKVKDSLITESLEVKEEEVTEEVSSKMKVSELKAKIKEDIIAALSEGDSLEGELMADLEEVEELEEAKEDEDEVEIDVDMESEEDLGGDEIEDIDPEAGLSQNESDIQNALKVAYDNAIALGDEKLADQIGNTITMFTRTRVVNR